MTTAASTLQTSSRTSKYVVYNANTLCYRQPGSQMLGVLAGNINGRDWRNGPIFLTAQDDLRPATSEDFQRFRVMEPSDFGRDDGAVHVGCGR